MSNRSLCLPLLGPVSVEEEGSGKKKGCFGSSWIAATVRFDITCVGIVMGIVSVVRDGCGCGSSIVVGNGTSSSNSRSRSKCPRREKPAVGARWMIGCTVKVVEHTILLLRSEELFQLVCGGGHH